jgi:hypothetical protein
MPLFISLCETIMGYHLETFAAWLRESMSLSYDIEILIDRAAIPKDRKRRLTTRWDHLVKQQSFSMPKVPPRRRAGGTIEEDMATERSTQMIKQTSFCLPRGGTGRRLGGDGDEGAARPGMMKQTSLRSLSRQTSFNSLTKDEQTKMPRLVKQCSFRSPRPQRRCVSSGEPTPNHLPNKRLVRKGDSDETTDTLPCIPRMVKQTSSTDARLSSRGALIGDAEKGGNDTGRPRRMAKQDSFAMPRRPTRTFDRKDEMDERTDTLSSKPSPRLVKQTPFTVARISSQGGRIGNNEKEGTGSDRRQRMAKQNSLGTFESRDELDERTETLSSKPSPRLLKQTEGNGTDRRGQMAKQKSCPARTFYIEVEPVEMSETLSIMLRLVTQAKLLSPEVRPRSRQSTVMSSPQDGHIINVSSHVR